MSLVGYSTLKHGFELDHAGVDKQQGIFLGGRKEGGRGVVLMLVLVDEIINEFLADTIGRPV